MRLFSSLKVVRIFDLFRIEQTSFFSKVNKYSTGSVNSLYKDSVSMNVTKGTIYVKNEVRLVYDKKDPFSLCKINSSHTLWF